MARAIVLAGAIALVGVASAGGAWAQTASQITPPSFAPPVAAPEPPVSIGRDLGTEAPAGADRLVVRLAGLTVEGAAVDPAELDRLRAELVGHPVKVSEIFAAARALEARLAGRGRVLTRVVVPAQDLADGATLRLTVVRGMIERIDASRLPRAIRGRIAAVLAPLVGRADVTQAQIERRLLIAEDAPGVTLRSTLQAGATPGATVLIVEADYRPVTGFLTADNTLPQALGRYAFGVGINLNSVLGLGETIYARASGLPNTGRDTSVLDPTPRDRALAAGVIVPLGTNGLTVNVEGTDARTAPRHLAGLPGFGSRFRRLSGRVDYPFVRSRALTITGEASFDAEDERVRVIDPVVLPISLDRLRVARAAGDLAAYLPRGGILTARVQASFGIDGLGARTAGDATPLLPLSRAGSDADFRKLDAVVAYDQPVMRHLAVAVRARGQTSFGDVLGNAEQIGIATVDGISALPTGTLQGDAGYVARGELRVPFAVALGQGFGQLSPYGFGAAGGVRFERPTSFERRTTDARAWGGGVRLAAAARPGLPALSAGVEYARAHVDGFARHPDRVIFTVAAQF